MFEYQNLRTEEHWNLRWYILEDGTMYPSITSVLGETQSIEKVKSLENWRNSIGHENADKITRDAANRGTAVHLLAERFLKGEDLFQGQNFDPSHIRSFNALKNKLKNITEVWGQEVALYSRELLIAGRCDLICEYKGIPAIVDFKTSRKIKNSDDISDYKLQICAYAQMHNELFGTNINKGVILMTSDEGFPQEFHVDLSEQLILLKQRINDFYVKLSDKIVINK